jgi:hypothetical protein
MNQKKLTRPGEGRAGCDMLGRPSHPIHIVLGILRHLATWPLAVGIRAGDDDKGGAHSTARILPFNVPWGALTRLPISSPTLADAMQKTPANTPRDLQSEARHD